MAEKHKLLSCQPDIYIETRHQPDTTCSKVLFVGHGSAFFLPKMCWLVTALSHTKRFDWVDVHVSGFDEFVKQTHLDPMALDSHGIQAALMTRAKSKSAASKKET